MIREVSRKEYVERKPLMGFSVGIVMFLTALIPFVFAYSLQHAIKAAIGGNDTAILVLRNFRSYQLFIESQWIARNLSRILCLLALLGGASAVAGERERRTLPLLYTSSVSMRSLVIVKFGLIGTWLFLVALSSSAVLATHSFVAKLPFPVADVSIASLIAWTNALAFLAVVFAASAFAKRTIFAALIGLVAGFAIAALLTFAGLNGTALATNIFAVDGRVQWGNALLDLAVSLAIVVLGLGTTLIEVSRRRAT